MRTAAILPVKRFAAAKSRLDQALAQPLRERLARAMVGDVMLALSRTASIETTIVVTSEPLLLERPPAAASSGHRVQFIHDDQETGQSDAVATGVARAREQGFARVLCIPGDCPALDPAELDSLLQRNVPARAGDPLVVIVPDRHGTGTNGLVLTPPEAIAPSFGPGSCKRHEQLARVAGIGCRVERPSTLLLDVDTGDDLVALRTRLAEAREQPEDAASTRGVLGEPTAAASYAQAGRPGA